MPTCPQPPQDLQPWPVARKQAIVQDLLQGLDTMAGIAHRYDLSVQTLLNWREQYLQESGASGLHRDGKWAHLRMQGLQPQQSRLSGPC